MQVERLLLKMRLIISRVDSQLKEEVSLSESSEHVIGRGALLRCNDKRVSRNHALININGERATITSTHQNPCFYQSANSKTIVILPKDSPCEIEDNDKFGLFPDEFWYKIHIDTNIQRNGTDTVGHASINSSIHEITTDNNTSQHNMTKENVPSHDLNTSQTMEALNETDVSLRQTKNHKRHYDNGDDSEMEHKVAKVEASSSSSTNIYNTYKGTDGNLEEKNIHENAESQQSKEEYSSGDKNDVSILEGNVNKEELSASESDIDGETDVVRVNVELSPSEDENISTENRNLVESNELGNVKKELSDSVDDGDGTSSGNDRPKVVGPNVNDSNSNINGNTDKQDVADPNQASGSGDLPVRKVPRKRCWFATKCFRKNPNHKAVYSHPGDSDYDSDPNDNRPICSYGASCYRKNKDHRQEYKHPRSNCQPTKKLPLRRTRPKKNDGTVKKPTGNDESTEDEYDYDFFFDESSEDLPYWDHDDLLFSDDSKDEYEDYQSDIDDEDT